MDILQHFSAARQVLSVPPGLILFAEGDQGALMYILVEGEADIAVGGEVVEVATPPAFLGEMALIDQPVRSATVTSRTECKLLSVGQREFDLLVRESPEFAREVMRSVCTRLRATNDKLMQAIGEVSVRGQKPRA
jgi:CRP-like cAMP-binding protein